MGGGPTRGLGRHGLSTLVVLRQSKNLRHTATMQVWSLGQNIPERLKKWVSYANNNLIN